LEVRIFFVIVRDGGAMDPLSDVLSLLKLRSYMCGGFDHGGDWSIRFEKHSGVKCYALVSGQCWLCVDGVGEPVHLGAGDCFLLPSGRPFCLASDLALAPVDVHSVFQLPSNGAIRTINGGGGCFGIGGYLALEGEHAGILLGALPSIVHLRKESDKAAMRWSIQRMMEELLEPRPGSLLMAQHLAQMMLVQALRLHLAEGSNGGVGWLFALADPQMRAAIDAMHNDPGEGWTLQKLSQRAGMSRSSFALRFKETVGKAPLDYLTRWRMMLAADKLANSRDPVSVIARSLGYESEAAFSTAFKRVMGRSPRQYGRERDSTPPSESLRAVLV
jgi:AraC-like DNA-binding protein/mannose-6-phosphate isomerase-like protein (cupin superfamily)